MSATAAQLMHAPWLSSVLRWALVLLAIGLALAPGRVGGIAPMGSMSPSLPAVASGDAGSSITWVTNAPTSPPAEPPPGAPPLAPGPGSDLALTRAGPMSA